MVTISLSRRDTMVDSFRLKDVVRSNIQRLCQTTFPTGWQRYGEWRIGNTAGDPGDSLGIRLVGPKAGLWHDRATGEGGDFIALVQAKFGVGFREAVEWIERTLRISLQSAEAGERRESEAVQTQTVRQTAPTPEPPVLDAVHLRRMSIAAHRLARNPELFYEVLGNRPEISLDAVRGAALDGDLGYEPDCRFRSLSAPAVIFAYARGLKARWRANLLGERHIRWVAGNPRGECWRQSLLRRDHKRVYIFEGETDTLAALSLGLEDEDENVLMIGLAAASILPEPEPFTGRDVIISPDPDEAGKRAALKLEALLGSVAEYVMICEGRLV